MSDAASHTRPFPTDATSLVDHARSLDCIHCGLCLTTCPTYQLTGSETSSPRGRIHLMRAVAEEREEPTAGFAEEMDFCLVCRHCESVCPAGVEFGAMMEFTRGKLEESRKRGPIARLARWIGFRRVLPSRLGLKLAVSGLALAQRLRLTRLAPMVAGLRGEVTAALPPVPPRRERRPLPPTTPARGKSRGRVLVLEGCVMPELFGRVNHAEARLLAAAGFEVASVPKHVCCGALHAHNGELEQARELARSTIERFDAVDDSCPVVLDSAGCGAHMREYGRLLGHDPGWAARAEAFERRVVDMSEVLATPESLERLGPLLGDAPGLRGPITWDAPCHLCHGQQVRAQPLALLDALPGVERVALDGAESCCGSAGIYSVLRPEDSLEVLEPKLEALRRSGARTLVTANPGCHQQWQIGVERAGLDVEVVHLAEALDRALDR